MVNTSNSEMSLQAYTVTLLEIRFLDEGGKKICGGSVVGGSRFCMSLHHECSTDYHTCSREEVEDPHRGKELYWVVMAAPAPRITLSGFFQTVLSATTALMIQGFQGLPQSSYYLVRWVNIFQLLKVEALETPMLSPDGIKRAK